MCVSALPVHLKQYLKIYYWNDIVIRVRRRKVHMKQIGIIIVIFIFIFVTVACCIINKRKKKKESGLRSESIVYRDLETDLKNNNYKNYETCLDDNKYIQFKEKLKNYGDDELHHAIALISGELKALDVEAIKGAVYIVIFTSASFIVTENLITSIGMETQTELLSNCMIVIVACVYMLGLLKDYTNKKWQEYFVQILRVELERREKEQVCKIEMLEKQAKENAQLEVKIENLEKEVRELKKKEKKVEFIIWK